MFADKQWKELKCAQMDEWTNKVWSIHTMEYYLAQKGRKFWLRLQHG